MPEATARASRVRSNISSSSEEPSKESIVTPEVRAALDGLFKATLDLSGVSIDLRSLAWLFEKGIDYGQEDVPQLINAAYLVADITRRQAERLETMERQVNDLHQAAMRGLRAGPC